ncbi:MAG: PAC2 family protein [Thermodesulfobacteriota bacterium]
MNESNPASSYLRWNDVPSLRFPFMIMGFYGWSNAGNASSETMAYLMETLGAATIAYVSHEPFLNYTEDRPVGEIRNGLIQHIEPSSAAIKCWVNDHTERDLILFLDHEPHTNWSTYTELIMGAVNRLGVERVYTIGGVQDTVSHVSTPMISTVASTASMVAEAIALGHGIRPSEYVGPISIHSRVIQACSEAGVEAVSLWAHVPVYLQSNPRVVSKLVKIMNMIVGMRCPIEPLHRKAIDLDRKINEAIAEDPNLKQFVESIEGKEERPNSLGRGEKIIHLNDFLRRDPRNDTES